MQHVRVATYTVTKGTFQEVADAAEAGMLPTFRAQPGFVSYGVADLGDEALLSISIWQTRQAAEQATSAAAEWVKENLSERIELVSSQVGDLAFLA
jgi:heme-degrading monooxygenase HmoA